MRQRTQWQAIPFERPPNSAIRPIDEKETAEKSFAIKQKKEISEIADAFTWSPWRATKPTQEDTSREDRVEPTEELLKWKLRDRCLRTATYYRVVHSHIRAAERRRMTRIKARFQRWAASWLAQEKSKVADTTERAQWQSHEDNERARRGTLPSANTRMECKKPDTYRNGVRRYKPRTNQHVINRRLLNKKTRKVNIVTGAEIGPRLYENMMIIAKRCERERQKGDG